jgi:hypothetical protein
MPGVPGWLARLTNVQKVNTRIDVLMQATVRALTQISDFSIVDHRLEEMVIVLIVVQAV